MLRTMTLRVLAAVLAPVLLLGCSGGDDDDGGSPDGGSASIADDAVEGLPSSDELEAGLVDVSDLPPGWSESADEEGDDDDEDSLCDVELAELLELDVEELPNAERSFEQGAEGPFFGESLGFVPEGRGGDALELTADALDGCEDEVQGEPAVVQPLSFPTVGEESVAFRMTVGDEASDVVIDFAIVYARVDDLVLVLFTADTFGSATDLLQDLAGPAVEKATAALL